MKTALLLFFFSLTAQAGSWYYNQNGGFGIYEPLGWHVEEEGRSARLHGPARDFDQTLVFVASDWIEKAKDLASLESHLRSTYPALRFTPTQVEGLQGFEFSGPNSGMKFIFRAPENIILIGYELKGSQDQIEEGKLALSSVSIRTRGIEYP